jgi:membrane protein involved in colicin uptake
MKSIQGSIDVMAVMEEYWRLRDWQERQRRAVEWWALKEYWKAEEEERPEVVRLYGVVLVEALEKRKQANERKEQWRKEVAKIQRERWARSLGDELI